MHFVHLRWRRPRHPVLQGLLGLAAVGLLLFFSVFALFAAAGFLVVLGLMRAWRSLIGQAPAGAARAGEAGTIEGEYTVVRERDSRVAVQHIRSTP